MAFDAVKEWEAWQARDRELSERLAGMRVTAKVAELQTEPLPCDDVCDLCGDPAKHYPVGAAARCCDCEHAAGECWHEGES